MSRRATLDESVKYLQRKVENLRKFLLNIAREFPEESKKYAACEYTAKELPYLEGGISGVVKRAKRDSREATLAEAIKHLEEEHRYPEDLFVSEVGKAARCGYDCAIHILKEFKKEAARDE